MRKIQKKPGRSIFMTQSASYLLIILVTTVTFSLLFFSTARLHLEREVGRKLQDIASIAARNAPFERLDLIKIGDDQKRMVLRLREKLGEIREATGVRNIVIFRPDQTSLLDLKPDRPIGTAYELPHFRETFTDELARGEAISTGSYRSPSGKLTVSAYAPVMDIEGRLFAVVGVDADTREVEVIEQMRRRLYLIAAAGVVLAFLLSLFLARTLIRPISDMALTAARIGHGNYEARVALPATAELRVLADSINSMADRVRHRDMRLKEMSASVAHEIRNPLNSIKLLIQLLEEELQDQEGAAPSKSLDTLYHEIAKLNRFLTEFLTYSRPITLVRDDVAPADLAEAAADMVRAEAAESAVEIIVTATPDLPDIRIDRDRVEQSLLNILLNAVHACSEGGRVELKVNSSEDGESVDFIVEDTGPGIQEELKDKLFEPFFTTKDAGTGLGLSNAQKIMRSHGGGIHAANRPARGARFTIQLPLGKSGTKET